jgi:dTDP-4-amino-4,6-dideoxygalactose transaminase
VTVPFTNLTAHHAPLKEQICDAIADVIDAGAFAGGAFVESFETDFAAYCGTRYAIGVGSGTEALWLSLLALGVGPGDEVITVPMTFIATAEAISLTGATPVFVDINDETYTMDVDGLSVALTSRTKAIIPVHLFGQPADMEPILAFAREHGLYVIEDAAQAHGAEYQGRKVGSIGDAGCYSFYPGKNLGAIGEGGAIVTDDHALAEKVRILRDHGQSRKYHHSVIGWNGRMDAIQGAVLRIKLRHLDEHNRMRQSFAIQYEKALGGIDEIILPVIAADRKHVFHIYAIRTDRRAELIDRFAKAGIGHGIHYPVPIHLQPAYASLGCRRGTYPVAERCANTFLSLPMSAELTSGQIWQVADVLRQALSGCLAGC